MASKLNKVSYMPQMGMAFSGWTTSIDIGIVAQTVVNGDVVNTINYIKFEGVIQPLTAEQLRIKPEGERSFEWLMIHCVKGELNLNTNDVIMYNSKRYKVMGQWDWNLDNFLEYQIIEDFQP